MTKQVIKIDAPLDDDEAIRSRLEEIIRSRSQAEVARKTETSHTNISRYLKGTKPPAAFLARLARSMHINPSWLLLGEGAADLSSVTGEVSAMGGNVLELVNAMNSVAKMKLGELLGKDHLKVLRQLSDALNVYDDLRDKLNQKSRHVMDDLIQKTDRALEDDAPKDAKQSIEAAKQLSRLCDSQEIQLQLLDKEFWYEYQWGTPHKAFDIQRKIFHQKLANLDQADEDFCRYAYQYVMALHAEHRIREALTVASTAHGLAYGAPGLRSWRKQLLIAKGMLYAELGSLNKALPIVFKHSQGLDGEYLKDVRPIVAVTQLYAGLTSIEALAHLKHTWNRAMALHCLRFARVSENKKSMELAYKYCVGDKPKLARASDVTAKVTRFSLMALEGQVDKAIQEFKETNEADERQRRRLQEPIYSMINQALFASIYRLGSKNKQALKHTVIAQDLLKSLDDVHQPAMIVRIYHATNILKLIPVTSKDQKTAKIREGAERFVRRSINRGYRIMEHLSPLLTRQT